MKFIIILAFLGLSSSLSIKSKNQNPSLRDDEVIIGDMILTKYQYEAMFGDVIGGIAGRSGIPDPSFRWTNNRLPYYIELNDFSPAEVEQIEEVIARFNYEMSGCFSIV